MDKEMWVARLNSLKKLQEKLKEDVEEQEIYIQSLQNYIDSNFKKEDKT